MTPMHRRIAGSPCRKTAALPRLTEPRPLFPYPSSRPISKNVFESGAGFRKVRSDCPESSMPFPARMPPPGETAPAHTANGARFRKVRAPCQLFEIQCHFQWVQFKNLPDCCTYDILFPRCSPPPPELASTPHKAAATSSRASLARDHAPSSPCFTALHRASTPTSISIKAPKPPSHPRASGRDNSD